MKHLGVALLTHFFIHEIESRSAVLTTKTTAFAGGFGGGNKSSTTPREKTKYRKKKNGLAEVKPPISKAIDAKDETKLDKWGLPVASVDELFPPLGPDVELLSVDPTGATTLSDITNYLGDYIDLRLERHFNSECIQKDADNESFPMKLRMLHKSPPVLQIENFLTSTECEEIKSAIEHSHEVNSATFAGALSTRTSTSWFCRFVDVPVLLAKANQLLNIPLETMEEPQIVRYKKGQEFSWHYDEVPVSQLDNGGQRLATLLIYLNNLGDECGGGTAFRDLQYDGEPLVMKPKQGSALLFFPASRDGTPDDRTLHRGEPIACDTEKWIVQMWIHKDHYKAVLPSGNSNVAARSEMIESILRLGISTESGAM